MIEELLQYTKSKPQRFMAMANCLKQIDDVPGAIVECGVWRGGNIILARKIVPDRNCWLYDTFDGMTEPQDIDHKKSGYKAINSFNVKKAKGKKWDCCSLQEVIQNFEATGTYDTTKLNFIVGEVEKTLLVESNLPDKIALLRLDTDWYASTKIELEVLYPRLMKGGILIVDDYGHWMGAKKAVDNYFKNNLKKQSIDYSAIMAVKH